MEGNRVYVALTLAPDCGEAVTLAVDVFGFTWAVPLKVWDPTVSCVDPLVINCHAFQAAVSPVVEATALGACQRVKAKASLGGFEVKTLSRNDITSLVTACSPAVSSLAVSTLFLGTVYEICCNNSANVKACGVAGVIPAVKVAMSTWGSLSSEVAVCGCLAFTKLAVGNQGNADAIVLARGLEDVYEVMVAHAGHEEVQMQSCWVLWAVVKHAGRAAVAVMRNDGRAVDLIRTAIRNHPRAGNAPGEIPMTAYADEVLSVLTTQ